MIISKGLIQGFAGDWNRFTDYFQPKFVFKENMENIPFSYENECA